MISQINLVFQKFLKRKINQKEIDLINNQIKKRIFNMDKLVHNILTSKEYTLLCLKNIESIFKSINYDVKSIKESIIISFIKKLQKGDSINSIKKMILKNYKIKNVPIIKKNISLLNNKQQSKTKNINKIFNKVLKRNATKSEIKKYENYSSNQLENELLHTNECSIIIDKELEEFVKQMTNL